MPWKRERAPLSGQDRKAQSTNEAAAVLEAASGEQRARGAVSGALRIGCTGG